MRFFHYTLGRWKREPVKSQAQMIAHFLEHGIRDAFAAEKAKAAAQKEDPEKGNPPEVRDFFKYRQGGGKE